MTCRIVFLCWSLVSSPVVSYSFCGLVRYRRPVPLVLSQSKESAEYVNPVTKILGSLLPRAATQNDSSKLPKDKRNKRRKTSLIALAKDLERALTLREWFVTGDVDKSFFSDDFRFQDPDVKIQGIEEYRLGVRRLFSQKDSRAEVVDVFPATATDEIIVTWRLSGTVQIGPGLKLKPFLVFTTFKVDPASGLIVFQEDKFSIPTYDILLSSLFPFLQSVPGLLKPPCPPIEELRSRIK